MASKPLLSPIELLYVVYTDGDLVGYVLAWISLLPIFIFVGLFALGTLGRSRLAAYLAAGQLANEFVNQTLKRLVFRQPRPFFDDSFAGCLRRSDSLTGGMPSDHSQQMSYLFAAISVFLIVRARRRRLGLFVGLILLIAALATGVSRIYLGYHTVLQVIVGFVLGCTVGSVWAYCAGILMPIIGVGMNLFNYILSKIEKF